MPSEGIQIRNMLILDKDMEHQVRIRDENYVVRAMTQRDRKIVSSSVALAQNGLPANSFDVQDRYLMRRNAVIEQCLVKGPEWWTGVDNCLEEELLDDLYTEIQAWDSKFQEALKKNRLVKRGQGPEVSG